MSSGLHRLLHLIARQVTFRRRSAMKYPHDRVPNLRSADGLVELDR